MTRRKEGKRVSIDPEIIAARNAYIVDAYAQNIPVKDICAATGLTYGSLKVIASRLGCTKKGTAWTDYRRGYSVPPHLAERYNDLVYNLKFKAQDAASMLGIPPLECKA